MKILAAFAFSLLLSAVVPAAADAPGGTGTAPSGADRATAAAMAQILLNMHHFPSDQQKSTLTQIAANEQVATDLRIIAGAISNIQHQVPDADRPALQAIVDDPSSSDAAKTLAGAALRFKHQAADQDTAALKGLAT